MHYLFLLPYNSLTPGGPGKWDIAMNPFSRYILNLCIFAIASHAFLK
jgi:hypothetical protein